LIIITLKEKWTDKIELNGPFRVKNNP